ncbi:MAG: conjugal transfer protein TraN, partial [Oligoflexia bacterium]|nr:conjugal transfer protein TraN [Oligoflexia bacterium]
MVKKIIGVKIKNIILIVMLIMMPTNKLLGSDINEAGKDFANEMNKSIGSIGANTNPNNIPGYKGSDVAETKYYESGLKLEDEAKIDTRNNPNGNYLKTAIGSRPKITIDPTKDPLFKRYGEVEEKSHNLSQTYQGCKKLPVGVEDITQYDKKTCFVYGRRDQVNFRCDKRLDVTCRNANAGELVGFNINDFAVSGPAWDKRDRGFNILFGADYNDRHGNCTNFTNTIIFYLRNIEDVIEFRIESFVFDDWITISLNGHTTYSEPFSRCERGQIFSKPGFDLKQFLQNGTNNLTVVNLVAGGGRAFINLRAIKRIPCDQQDNYIYNCDGNQNYWDANLDSSRCMEGASSRSVRNTTVYRGCWRWEENYSKLTDPIYTKDPLCDELVKSGCGITSRECIEL